MHILGGTMFSHAVALTVASIIAFAAANIGDLIVLMLFFAVAGISFADCSDDLAVFTPLYVRSSAGEKVLITMVFLVLIGAWCGVARFLTRNRTLGTRIRRIGDLIAPYALIGLGLFIMSW